MTTKQVTLKTLHGIDFTAKHINEIKRYVEKGEIPVDIDEVAYKKSRFINRYKHFVVKDDELYMKYDEQPYWTKDKIGNQLYTVKLPVMLKVVENNDERKDILQQIYGNTMINGYRSADSLYETISKQYLNISREDVRKFINQMEVKQLQAPAVDFSVNNPIVIDGIMKQWQLDLIDMSAYSKKNENINFVLTIIDCHSKFSFVVPLKNKSAELVAYELQNIIYREGIPEVIQSDRGSEFLNDKMAELCNKFGIKQNNSLPYSPQSNGQIERLNKSLKESIYSYLTDHNSERYIDVLQSLVFSYNNKKHSSTKYTPFQVHRGRDNLISGLVHHNLIKNADKMVKNELRRQQALNEELSVGDTVRLSSITLAKVRKLSKVQSKSRITSNWSKQTYKIIEIKQNSHGINEYKINNDETKYYHRYQLMKIDNDKLIPIKDVFDKEDTNYGAKFDTELHIKTLGMSKKDYEVADMEQEELVEMAEEEQARPKRNRKQTDLGPVIFH